MARIVNYFYIIKVECGKVHKTWYKIGEESSEKRIKSLLDKYQIMLNETFTKVDQNYLAFCALITTDELRSKLMKKFNIG